MYRMTVIAAVLWCQAAVLFAQESTVSAFDKQGDDSTTSDPKKEALETLKAYYRYAAEQYEFKLDEAGREKLKLEATIMTWTGEDYKFAFPTIAPVSGEAYVWTYQGRAVFAGGIGSFPYAASRDFFHEFYVLTEWAPQPTAILSLDTQTWRPTGEKPRPIPDAPAPATSSTPSIAQNRRLVQMRKLAQGFQGSTINPEGTRTAKLRMLRAPIYRLDAEALETDKHNIVDGALFVFTGEVGTDPEMMLYIECRKTDNGLEWTNVPAAMTYLELWLEYQGKEVWRLPNYLKDQGEHNYITVVAERIAPDVDLRERIGDKK